MHHKLTRFNSSLCSKFVISWGLCVFAHRYLVFKTHMMHVVENISSYLYMHHDVLDAQHPCPKNTNS